MQRSTRISIEGDRFLINGTPTYAGRVYNGMQIEGLLLNSRMVQAIFDDENPETQHLWRYPDTGAWDAERNVQEFLDYMQLWRDHGMLALTLNLQGGCPRGYCKEQPWINSALASDGSLKTAYMQRLQRILDHADEIGMVIILGIYYFGQDERLHDEAAVIRGVDETVHWLLQNGYTNVLLEINNECNVPKYEHAILQPQRVHELIERARTTSLNGQRLPVGTSYGGGAIPGEAVVAVSDFLLLHGNGVKQPARITQMVEQTRARASYRPMPVVFNEDDHFEFDQPENNMLAAIAAYASWGFFDAGPGSGGGSATGDYIEGYQNVPVNWGINTPTKQGFFRLLKQISGV